MLTRRVDRNQDLQRQLDVLSQALPPGDEPLGQVERSLVFDSARVRLGVIWRARARLTAGKQEGYPEAASLQQRVKQLLRENAECHAQIRLLGSEAAPAHLPPASDVVELRASVSACCGFALRWRGEGRECLLGWCRQVVGLSEALDVVTKRAQNNDVRHQHFQVRRKLKPDAPSQRSFSLPPILSLFA